MKKRLRQIILFVLSCLTPIAATAQDQLDLHAVPVFNSPTDIADWPATAHISQVRFSPENGVSVDFDKAAVWPDFIPPGWKGPIEYTLWLVVPNTGMSGFIQMWHSRPGSGSYETGSFFTDYNINWAYDGRWGALQGYHPKPGDQVGVFVSAGNARGESGVTSNRERSNVVVVSLPANDRAVYTFDSTPVPTPTPVPPSPQPLPTPTPSPVVSCDLTPVLTQLVNLNVQTTACNEGIAAVNKNVSDGRAENQQFYANVKSTWQQIGGPIIVKYVLPALAAYFAGKKL